ncbi:hypothetical protein K501DRAFT_315657, partial [Backusella circina FSU 941]
MSNVNIEYFQSSSDSETESLSVHLVEDAEEGSYRNSIMHSDDELIFSMDNMTDSTTDYIKSSVNDIYQEPPPLSLLSYHSKNSNATVMMRSSSTFQNRLMDPTLMLSRSLGAFEMGDSFLSSHEALCGTSLPNDLSFTIQNWDVSRDTTVVFDDKRVVEVSSTLKQESVKEQVEEPSLEETPPSEANTCSNKSQDSPLISNQPSLQEVETRILSEDDDSSDETTSQDSPQSTNIIFIGEIPVIGKTSTTSDTMFVKEVPEPTEENDAQTMTTYEVSTTTYGSTDYDPRMMLSIPAPPFTPPHQEWFNPSQNCFFKENVKKRPKKNSHSNKQATFQIYKKMTVLKVIGLNINTIFRDLQRHFYDPSVLNIRYLRPLGTAYITFRNYMSMMNAILKLDGT